jgi:ribonuclease Z
MGTAAFCDHMQRAALWHTESKKGLVPSGGMEIVAHEFDSSEFTPDSPRQLIYDENDVKVYAFPVAHILVGAVGYRLEWNGLSMTFHGDGEPSVFEAEQAAGADVFMHECFPDAASFAQWTKMPLETAKKVVGVHTTPDRLGKLFDVAKPNLGVAYHYSQSDDRIDPFFESIQTTYDGPVAIAQDLTVINVTPDQIVLREAQTDLLHDTPPGPEEGPPEFDPKNPGVTPSFVTDTILPVD